MILYGRNLSPYARRCAIWAALQGAILERREISPFDNAEAVAEANPMMKVPALVLEDGAVLVESWAICDHLDEAAGSARLIPASGPARRAALRRIALAHGLTESLVRLFYETERREPAYRWPTIIARLDRQCRAGLDLLETETPEQGFFGGERPEGADIAFAVAHDFARATTPALLEADRPRLAALSARCDALPAFADTRP